MLIQLILKVQLVDSCKVKEKEISLSLSSEKYDKVYLVPQETDGVPILTK
jgi:hypothetical protein